MTFRGPSYNGSFGFERGFELERQARNDAFDQALQTASLQSRAQPMRVTDADNGDPWIERDIPRRGSVADMPALNRSSLLTAARNQGEAEATRQVSAEQTRLQALRNIPGMSPLMASRIVFGRSGMEDADVDPVSLRGTIAEYVRNPTREAAARAISAGADLNKFPDRFLAPEGTFGPTRGTPQYEDMLRREGDIELETLRKAAPIRAEATAAARAPTRDRTELRRLKDGTIVRVNLETGTYEPVSDLEGTVAEGPPRTKPSLLDTMLQNRGGAPARPDATAAGSAVDPQERAAFTAAYSRLRARGVRNITKEMVRSEMTRNGTGR